MGEEADYFMERAMDDWDFFDGDEDPGLFIEGKQTAHTPKAILFVRDSDQSEYWIPRSQIIRMDEASITITTWLADKKGWLDDEEIPF